MSVTLDSIRKAADAKYGSYDIVLSDETTTKLLNPLRLSEEKRAELKQIQGELSASVEEEDSDQIALFQKALMCVAETNGQGERLVAEVGRDLALLAEIFNGYSEGTQAGEA